SPLALSALDGQSLGRQKQICLVRWRRIFPASRDRSKQSNAPAWNRVTRWKNGRRQKDRLLTEMLPTKLFLRIRAAFLIVGLARSRMARTFDSEAFTRTNLCPRLRASRPR